MDSLQAAALQLRVLWACARWDDMTTRPLSGDGKHYQTTDSVTTTTEILRHRHRGRFHERTQYLKKIVTVPLDVPKNTVEVTPIRSGLRKRKRAESPQNVEPKVEEKWVEEEKLELWEIRAYRERIERDRNAPVTRVRTGTTVREPQRYDPGALAASVAGNTSEVVKKPTDSTYGRETIRIKVDDGPTRAPVPTPPQPMIVRRVTHPDGSVSLVRTPATTATPTRPIAPNSAGAVMPGVRTVTSGAQVVSSPQPPPTKKVFISKDGKIIGAQVVPVNAPPQQQQQQPKVAIPANPTAVLSPQQVTTTTTTASPQLVSAVPQQKVQIVRSSDGKIQVRGLMAGQQLMQMADGKLQIVAAPNAAGAAPKLPTTPTPAVRPATAVLPAAKMVGGSPVAATLPASPASSPQVAQAPQQQGSPRQIVAHQLAPGSQIPPGMTTFMQGGKTYCIPKASTQFLQQAPQVIQQQKPAAAAAPTIIQQQQQQPAKQMVEVKTLGANTVTFKNQQMIVSGPDVAQAQAIANQLSTGAARLATLGGKQVLISTTSASAVQQQQQQGKPQVVAAAAVGGNASPALVPGNRPSTPQKQEPAKQEPIATSPSPSAPAAPAVQQVTAQLLQTAQGPRIVLQGIQAAAVPHNDLVAIQQLVKQQLLKAQGEAKAQGKVREILQTHILTKQTRMSGILLRIYDLHLIIDF
jgi:nucleosome-remodeling factor subunit BPTF